MTSFKYLDIHEPSSVQDDPSVNKYSHIIRLMISFQKFGPDWDQTHMSYLDAQGIFRNKPIP